MSNGTGFELAIIEKAAQDHSTAITQIAGNSSLETASKQSVQQDKGSVKGAIHKNGENDVNKRRAVGLNLIKLAVVQFAYNSVI